MARDPEAHKRALKHGAYSRDLVVPTDGLTSRPEVVQALRIRAARAVAMCDVIGAYVASKVQEGADIDDIPAVSKLPAFQNSATRLLTALYAMLPSDEKMVDVTSFEVSGEDQPTD